MNYPTSLNAMKTDTTICLNSKVNGKQPSLEHRIYWWGGVAPAITTCFFYNVLVYENNPDSETGAERGREVEETPPRR